MSRFHRELLDLRPRVAEAAQRVYDEWEQDAEGQDEERGSGGICDGVADAISDVLGVLDADHFDGGQEGDDHAFVIVQRGEEAYGVDIPPGVYETGGGYNWKKRIGVKILPEHVVVFPVPIQEGEGYEGA